MLYYPITQEVARYELAERLATAERRNRLFRTPLGGSARRTGGVVIPMPTSPSRSNGQSAHVA